MRIFLTGATGFIGSAIVQELINAGHHVLGLARSETAAAALAAAGAQVHRGDLEDLDSLKSGAAASDGVIHTGFIHDFSRFKAVCEIDRLAIETLGGALAGSDRPLIVTSGTALVSPGQLATEDVMPVVTPTSFPRIASEEAVNALAARGVRVAVVRLSPSVHGDNDHGFVPNLINLAREKGVSAYIGEGLNRWTAVHRLDAAPLFRLALEKATAGARFHGVAEEGIAFREIAEVIGKRLNIPVVAKTPEEAADHFGWFAAFAGLDCPASSQRTRELLGWRPKQPGLILDLDQSTRYFNV
jgi:nucleoside-diphosphate-sugar epimerase